MTINELTEFHAAYEALSAAEDEVARLEMLPSGQYREQYRSALLAETAARDRFEAARMACRDSHGEKK